MEQLKEVPEMVSQENPATDCRADRRHASLQGSFSGRVSAAICGAEHRKSRG